MPIAGNIDQANNAPKTKQVATTNVGVKANANGLYQNTTPAAFTNGQVMGLYGVTNTMVKAAAANHGTNLTGMGWTLVRRGTGPVASITASPGGTSYNNTDVYTISGNGIVNCTSHPVTNSTGGITGFTIINPGANFPNTAFPTKAWANSTGGATSGSGATVTFTLGGRAGRVNREILQSMRSMTSSANTAEFPNV